MNRSLAATIFGATLIVLALAAPFAAGADEATSSSLIVKLVVGLSPEQQAAVIARNGGIQTSSIPALRLHIIEVAAADFAATLARYHADPQVVSAEENKLRKSGAVPSDALYTSQWALPKIGWD